MLGSWQKRSVRQRTDPSARQPCNQRMCFSATASFSAGVGLLLNGAVAARRVQQPQQWPYALIPTLFGVQQLVEGGLWLTLPDKAPLCSMVLTQVFSGFSQVLWPVCIPLAVFLLEPTPWRRTVLLGTTVGGATVALFLLVAMFRHPVLAALEENHIQYVFPHLRKATATTLYLLGACASPLLSSHRMLQLFGLASCLSLVAAYALYSNWFISVWCFFAAVLSAVVLLYFPARRRIRLVEPI